MEDKEILKNWREKAVYRNAENKELKKRIKEISNGRDNWKEKYKIQKQEANQLKLEIELIKKNIEKILLK